MTLIYRLIVVASLVFTSSALAQSSGRRVLAADYSKKRIAILDSAGRIEWEYKINDIHDLHLLPGGNVLFQTSMTRLLEIDPKTNRVVWEYNAQTSNGNAGKKVEVHSFQRLPDGSTMIAESGPARIIEVDGSGKILRQVRMKVDHPSPHRDTRLVRKLASGNYLVCHEADGAVREYDPAGTIVWEYGVPMFGRKPAGGHGPEAFGNSVFGAVRLGNGNTLIATGNGHSVLEVTPQRQIVWKLEQNELPGITLAWVTTLQALPNGNIILGNCHAGPQNPQIIEVTRDKKVVWSFKDFDRFGDATSNSQVVEAGVESIR